ncbi:hypothetical protein PC120_g18428 [Phytophthora cactorum]|nr:hypothetical protein PC120_g18428 [Phytophthora cactorum]
MSMKQPSAALVDNVQYGFAVALALAVVILDPVNANLADKATPSSQILRTTDGDRLLEAESASADDFSALYEANTKIKGCHWYDYFLPWSCCGANSC